MRLCYFRRFLILGLALRCPLLLFRDLVLVFSLLKDSLSVSHLDILLYVFCLRFAFVFLNEGIVVRGLICLWFLLIGSSGGWLLLFDQFRRFDLFRLLELQPVLDLPQALLQLPLFQTFGVQSLEESLELVFVLVVEPVVLGLSQGDLFLANVDVVFTTSAI